MLKEIRKNYKRLVAFLLSITMIIMNMGGNAITAFAGEEREISLFMAEGEKILEAAAHLQDQEEFTKEDLEEMGLESCGMLLSAVHTEKGEEALHLVMVDDAIPAGAKLC